MSNAALEIAYWVNQTAEVWWRSLGYATVQVAIVASVGLVLVSLGKRWSSTLRYGILLVLLAKFVITPVLLLWSPAVASDLVTVEVPVRTDVVTRSIVGSDEPPTNSVLQVQEAPSQAIASPVVNEPVLPEPASLRDNPTLWSLITLKGWGWLLHLSGSVIVVLWLLSQSVGLMVWVVRRSEPASFEIESLCLEVQRELRYFKRLTVRVGAEAGSPMAFQLLRPVIILPRTTIETLSRDELRPVLAHEIAHLRRRDPLVNTLQILLFGIWWFHPAYWWLSRRLRSVREECCDDVVLSLKAQGEDGYCQTLLDAARSCRAAVAGRVVLGFGESRSSLGQRIARILDPRANKRARLGFLAAVVLVVAIVASVPMWRTSSSLEHPRPVKEVDFGPSALESLMGKVGIGHATGLPMGNAEFAALEDCIAQSKLTRRTINNVTDFERPSTREALGALCATMAEPFYAEFLLAKWYEVNGDPNEAARWMAQSLADAPVVLVRRYELMDGRVLANTPVGSLGIEYRVTTPAQRNTDLVLDYINLTTDEKGQVYLPGYDTKIRSNGVTWPKGYDVETGRHGYLALSGRYNRLPNIYVWPKDLRRPATTLPTSEFYDYRDAIAAQGLTHRVGLAELSIDRCYRLGGDGLTISNGRESIDVTPESSPVFVQQSPHSYRFVGDGRVTASNGRENAGVAPKSLPVFVHLPSPALDQALITFKRSTLKSHEILQVRVFDHDSRTLLREYHAPADYEYDGNSTISLRSLGAELPQRVDVWFWVTEFAPDQGKQVIPAQIGSQVDLGGYRATLRALHSGNGSYTTKRSSNGNHTVIFRDPNESDAREMQVAFQIEAQEGMRTGRYGRVAVVTKDGQRYFQDHVIYASDGLRVYDFYVGLADVDHFELLPIGEEHCFYFDGVLLPERSGPPLEREGVLEADVETKGKPGRFVANLTDSIKVEVFVVPGWGSTSHSAYSSGLGGSMSLESCRPRGTYTDTDNRTTIIWRFMGLSTRLLETDIADLSGAPFEVRGGSGRSGSFYHKIPAVPVDQIQGVRVRLSREVTP